MKKRPAYVKGDQGKETSNVSSNNRLILIVGLTQFVPELLSYQVQPRLGPLCYWFQGHCKVPSEETKNKLSSRTSQLVQKIWSQNQSIVRDPVIERAQHVSKETFIREKRPAFVKRDLHTFKRDQEKEANKSARPCNRKSPIYVKRDLQLWKETYICEKRPMWTEAYTCEKRPTFVKKNLYMRKETYICEKRPTYVKRNLHAF